MGSTTSNNSLSKVGVGVESVLNPLSVVGGTASHRFSQEELVGVRKVLNARTSVAAVIGHDASKPIVVLETSVVLVAVVRNALATRVFTVMIASHVVSNLVGKRIVASCTGPLDE